MSKRTQSAFSKSSCSSNASADENSMLLYPLCRSSRATAFSMPGSSSTTKTRLRFGERDILTLTADTKRQRTRPARVSFNGAPQLLLAVTHQELQPADICYGTHLEPLASKTSGGQASNVTRA